VSVAVSAPATVRARLAGALPIVLIVTAGCVLRFWHLGTFSLWWDEIVHVWTAQSRTFGEVWTQAKQGIPPGSGNAGAVPLDYVLLHLWLLVAPLRSPETLEIHFRLPSFVYACAALPALYAFGRRFLDEATALVATLLLALSIPHVLYAAEARFYALFVLMTIVNLYAFAHLLERRDDPVRWVVYAVVGALLFLSGLFGLFLLALQYAALAVLALLPLVRRSSRDRRDPAAMRRELGALLASGAVLAACVAAYFADITLGHTYGRNPSRIPRTLDVLSNALLALSSDSRMLATCLLLLPVPLIWAWRRRTELFALIVTLELSLLAIPLIVELARWKRYYFHTRHALFLLPAIEILIAITLLSIVRALDPSRWTRLGAASRARLHVAIACGVVLAVQLPVTSTFVAHPERFFGRSKKTYDLRGLTHHVRDTVASYRPGDKYLLALQRNVMANATLAQYLRWYGLGDRVVLRGAPDAAATVARGAAACSAGCIGERGPVVDRALRFSAPFGLPPDFQKLLDLLKPIGAWPGVVREIGVVAWAPLPRPAPDPRWRPRALRGCELWRLAPSDRAPTLAPPVEQPRGAGDPARPS
jgi:hypothetical protein